MEVGDCTTVTVTVHCTTIELASYSLQGGSFRACFTDTTASLTIVEWQPSTEIG